jgi:hypothetical protein
MAVGGGLQAAVERGAAEKRQRRSAALERVDVVWEHGAWRWRKSRGLGD